MVTQAAYIARPLRAELAPWFAGFEDDYDMDAICREYADELEARLVGMPGFSALSWPADRSPVLWVKAYTDHKHINAIRVALDAARRPAGEGGVDLEAIARRHERERVAVWTGAVVVVIEAGGR